MANEGWTTLDVSATPAMVESLETFKTNAQAAANVVETLANTVKALVDVLSKLLVDFTDLAAEAVLAAIEALREIIKDLTQSAGAYFLFVPMHVIDPLEWTGDPATYYLANNDNQSVPILSTAPGPDTIAQPAEGGAGNYGFYTQVAESLSDDLDINRPQFDEDAYVGATVLLYGADSFQDLLVMARKLMRLFDLPEMGIDLAPDTIPVPTGLRTTIVPNPLVGSDSILAQYTTSSENFATQPNAVKLEWNSVDKDWVISKYGDLRFTIDEVRLYRWEDGEYTPKQVQAGDGPDPMWSVEYDGLTTLVFDTDIEPGKTYWYALCYTINVLNDDDTVARTLEPPYIDLADIRVVIPTSIHIAPQKGVPPDWTALPIFSAIPSLDQLVIRLERWLDIIEAGVKSTSDDVDEYVAFLNKMIDRYTRQIQEITSAINDIVDALTWPSVYGGMWNMKPGKGGNQYFLKELGKALFEPTTPNRPAFDTGTEPVIGVVMYLGSDTAGEISKFVDTIDLLFGAFAASTQNNVSTALESMGVVEGELDRQIAINDALLRDLSPETEETKSAIDEELLSADEQTEATNQGRDAVTRVIFTSPEDALTSDK